MPATWCCCAVINQPAIVPFSLTNLFINFPTCFRNLWLIFKAVCVYPYMVIENLYVTLCYFNVTLLYLRLYAQPETERYRKWSVTSNLQLQNDWWFCNITRLLLAVNLSYWFSVVIYTFNCLFTSAHKLSFIYITRYISIFIIWYKVKVL